MERTESESVDSMLTQERLKHLLSYDQETGVFRNRVNRGRVRAGEISGTESGKPEYRYRMIQLDGKNYYGHHLAWLYVYGEFPKEVDHKDRNGLNNAISNLRLSNRSQNAINTQVTKPCEHGYRGVHFHDKGKPRIKRYQARIGVYGRDISLGYFATAEEASLAYVEAAEKYYGEFADRHRLALEGNDETTGSQIVASDH